MAKLDNHFKCPKSLKTMFALSKKSGSLKFTFMNAQAHANHAEYAVQNHVIPLPKPVGEKQEPKKKFGAEKYDHKAKKAA